jgi:lysophospholipase L1-like esterase
MSFPGVSSLMTSHNPDMVLLQLGVNDLWGGGTPIQTVLDRYATLVTQMRVHNPHVVVVVAQIHKINTIDCEGGGHDASAEELIHSVPAWAAGMSTAEAPVLVADLWTNSFVEETIDCVHPDEVGAARMGENWFNASADYLRLSIKAR